MESNQIKQTAKDNQDEEQLINQLIGNQIPFQKNSPYKKTKRNIIASSNFKNYKKTILNILQFQHKQKCNKHILFQQQDQQKFEKIWAKYKFKPQQFIQSLNHNSIKYQPYQNQLVNSHFFIQYASLNAAFMKISVNFSQFVLKLDIFNPVSPWEQKYFKNWEKQDLYFINSGSFSQIYLWNNQISNQKVVVKKIKFSTPNDQISIQSAIYQYSFLKLASSLGIGLKVKKIFGFDLLCRNNQIYFCMEVGSLSEQIIDCQKLSVDILKSVLLLHSLQIVHCDIRLQNIQFSQQLNKYVLIDFGLSQNLIAKIGQSSFVKSFKGTFNYCSEQMQNLFFKQNLFIDLYFNDVICCLKTFIQLEQKTQFQFTKSKQLKKTKNNLQNNRKTTIDQNIALLLKDHYKQRNLQSNIQATNQNLSFECLIVPVMQLMSLIFQKDYKRIQQNIEKLNQNQLYLSAFCLVELEFQNEYGMIYEQFFEHRKILVTEVFQNKMQFNQKNNQNIENQLRSKYLKREKLIKSFHKSIKYRQNIQRYLSPFNNYFQGKSYKKTLYRMYKNKIIQDFIIYNLNQKGKSNLKKQVLKNQQFYQIQPLGIERIILIFFAFIKGSQKINSFEGRNHSILMVQFCLHFCFKYLQRSQSRMKQNIKREFFNIEKKQQEAQKGDYLFSMTSKNKYEQDKNEEQFKRLKIMIIQLKDIKKEINQFFYRQQTFLIQNFVDKYFQEDNNQKDLIQKSQNVSNGSLRQKREIKQKQEQIYKNLYQKQSIKSNQHADYFNYLMNNTKLPNVQYSNRQRGIVSRLKQLFYKCFHYFILQLEQETQVNLEIVQQYILRNRKNANFKQFYMNIQQNKHFKPLKYNFIMENLMNKFKGKQTGSDEFIIALQTQSVYLHLSISVLIRCFNQQDYSSLRNKLIVNLIYSRRSQKMLKTWIRLHKIKIQSYISSLKWFKQKQIKEKENKYNKHNKDNKYNKDNKQKVYIQNESNQKQYKQKIKIDLIVQEQRIIHSIESVFQTFSLVLEYGTEQKSKQYPNYFHQYCSLQQTQQTFYDYYLKFINLFTFLVSNVKFYTIESSMIQIIQPQNCQNIKTKYKLNPSTLTLFDQFFKTNKYNKSKCKSKLNNKQLQRQLIQDQDIYFNIAFKQRYQRLIKQIMFYFLSLEIKIKTILSLPLQKNNFLNLYYDIQNSDISQRKQNHKVSLIMRYVNFLQNKNNYKQTIQILERLQICFLNNKLVQIRNDFFQSLDYKYKYNNFQYKSIQLSQNENCQIRTNEKTINSLNFQVIKQNLSQLYKYFKSDKQNHKSQQSKRNTYHQTQQILQCQNQKHNQQAYNNKDRFQKLSNQIYDLKLKLNYLVQCFIMEVIQCSTNHTKKQTFSKINKLQIFRISITQSIKSIQNKINQFWDICEKINLNDEYELNQKQVINEEQFCNINMVILYVKQIYNIRLCLQQNMEFILDEIQKVQKIQQNSNIVKGCKFLDQNTEENNYIYINFDMTQQKGNTKQKQVLKYCHQIFNILRKLYYVEYKKADILKNKIYQLNINGYKQVNGSVFDNSQMKEKQQQITQFQYRLSTIKESKFNILRQYIRILLFKSSVWSSFKFQNNQPNINDQISIVKQYIQGEKFRQQYLKGFILKQNKYLSNQNLQAVISYINLRIKYSKYFFKESRQDINLTKLIQKCIDQIAQNQVHLFLCSSKQSFLLKMYLKHNISKMNKQQLNSSNQQLNSNNQSEQILNKQSKQILNKQSRQTLNKQSKQIFKQITLILIKIIQFLSVVQSFQFALKFIQMIQQFKTYQKYFIHYLFQLIKLVESPEENNKLFERNIFYQSQNEKNYHQQTLIQNNQILQQQKNQILMNDEDVQVIRYIKFIKNNIHFQIFIYISIANLSFFNHYLQKHINTHSTNRNYQDLHNQIQCSINLSTQYEKNCNKQQDKNYKNIIQTLFRFLVFLTKNHSNMYKIYQVKLFKHLTNQFNLTLIQWILNVYFSPSQYLRKINHLQQRNNIRDKNSQNHKRNIKNEYCRKQNIKLLRKHYFNSYQVIQFQTFCMTFININDKNELKRQKWFLKEIQRFQITQKYNKSKQEYNKSKRPTKNKVQKIQNKLQLLIFQKGRYFENQQQQDHIDKLNINNIDNKTSQKTWSVGIKSIIKKLYRVYKNIRNNQ